MVSSGWESVERCGCTWSCRLKIGKGKLVTGNLWKACCQCLTFTRVKRPHQSAQTLNELDFLHF